MELYDVTPAIRPGMPSWPGDTPYEEKRNWSIGADCPVNVGQLTMSTHTGAHADAPLHYDADGKPSGDLDLNPYLGPAEVVHALNKGSLVKPDDIADQLPDRVERVLIRTYEVAPTDAWDSDFTAIAPETIYLLAERGAVLIGVDTPSLDPETSKTMDAHNAVRQHDMRILEGLVLDAVEVGLYELIALPLKLANLDAAPVRAVLRRA